MHPGDSSKPVLSFFIGLLAVGVILLAALQLPNIAKTLGAPLMIWPEFVGATQRVRADEIVNVTLGVGTVESSAEIPTSGRYLIYTDDYQLLNKSVQSGSIGWMKLFSAESLARVPITAVTRGLRPYDTPLAAGRPIMRFEVTSTGLFNINHPSQSEPSTIYLVPDYLTDRETTLSILFFVQIAILVAIPIAFRHYITRETRRQWQAERAGKRARTEAFFENERKKRSAGETP